MSSPRHPASFSPRPTTTRWPSSLGTYGGKEDENREDRFDSRPVLRVRQDAGLLAGSAPLRTQGASGGRLGGPPGSRGKRPQRVPRAGSGAARATRQNQQGAPGPLHERAGGRG